MMAASSISLGMDAKNARKTRIAKGMVNATSTAYGQSPYNTHIGVLGGDGVKTVYQNCPLTSEAMSILVSLVRRINRAMNFSH